MDPKLQEMLGRLGELTEDELAELEAGLTKDFDRIDGAKNKTPADVDEMGKIADGLDQVRGEQEGRSQAQADADKRAEELRGRVHKDEDETPPADATPPGDETPPAGDEPPPAPAGDETPPAGDEPAGDEPAGDQDDKDKDKDKAIAASQRPPARTQPLGTLTKRQPHAPRDDALRAGGRTRSMSNSSRAQKMVGDDFDNFDQVVLAMCDRIDALGRGTGERFSIARVELSYPEERKLVNNDPVHNMKVMQTTIGPEALVAAGGICTPVDVDYSILVVADDDEPIADDLPTYAAGRGGLRYVAPPTLWGVGAAGTALWTEAHDAAVDFPNADGTLSGSPTVKPVQRFVCGDEVEVLVDAIATRIQFGNMMGRFSPEIVEANTKLALANAARFRETHRLNQIASHSTSVSSAQLLGASRDLLATMDLVSAAYRYRHRLNRSTVMMHAILPQWTIDLLRADLTRELAHDGDLETMSLTDAQVESLLKSRGWNVTWTLDSQGAGSTGAGGGLAYVDQTFGVATAGQTNPQGQGALLDWPHQVVWYAYVEGTFQRLDGGTLDLGVVRDPTYNSVNVYETFVETFESIAMRGVESLQVISNVRPNGLSAGSINTSTY